MISPKDDTYTFYYEHDNGGRFYFEGVKKIENWGRVYVTESFSMKMKANQLYKIIVELNDVGGLARAYLYWSYTDQIKTIIPSSNMKYLQYLKNIPLNLQVYPSCGNGVVTINEE